VTPTLLQQGPDFLKYLDELLVVVFMIGGALLPTIKQARERRRVEQAKRAEAEKKGARIEVPSETMETMETMASAATTQPSRADDLQSRVRDYFEQHQGAAPEKRRTTMIVAPEPPRAPAPARPEVAHLVHVEGLHTDLKKIEHIDRFSVGRHAPPRETGATTRRVKRPRLVRDIRTALRDKAAFKRAFILKEILDEPKGFESLRR